MQSKVKLRQGIEKCYSLDELRILCFDLSVDFDILSGTNKQTKSLELIEYLDRRNRLPNLVEYCSKFALFINIMTIESKSTFPMK